MAKTYNPENVRTKHRYLAYLREARRFSEASLDAVAAAIHRFETYTRFQSFKAFHIEQASGFKRMLAEQISATTGEPLSKATLYHTLTALKAFFHWLAGQHGFRRLSYSDADYFNLSERDTRIAKAPRDQRVPTPNQICHVLSVMPIATEIEKRNRALVALTYLTGARDGAIASLRMKHLDIGEGLLRQDAREVATKFRKSFPTWFFPVEDEVRAIVEDWYAFLEEKLWGPDDPLFPATRVEPSANLSFVAVGLDRRPWASAGPIRSVFKAAFVAAGLPYFNPHSFRKTLVTLGQRLCRTPEEFKAWSQNLGHEQVMTTFSSYGPVAPDRQAEIIRSCKRGTSQDDSIALALGKQMLTAARSSLSGTSMDPDAVGRARRG